MKFLWIFIFVSQVFFSQYSEKKIKTDSSEIKIIKNSKYKVWEEKLNDKDYIIHKSWFISDTTKISSEGIMDKNRRTISWKEYNENGDWLYSRDYKNGNCLINKSLYPYHQLFEDMKQKAEELIEKNYGTEFLANYVRFECDGNAYKKELIKWNDGTKLYSSKHVGSWTEPLKAKPDQFIFKYAVKVSDSDWRSNMIGIELDSLGNYVVNDNLVGIYGFEDVKLKDKKFNINYLEFYNIAITKGLDKRNELNRFLDWEKINPRDFYSGSFIFSITELIKIENYKKFNRTGKVYKFNVYVFNPWTGEFLEKKKMKSVSESETNSGMSTGLIPDKD